MTDEEISIEAQVSLKIKVTEVPCTSCDCDETIVVLHGYGEDKDRILKMVTPAIDQARFRTIALNAPFPIPRQTLGGWREGYAWYFQSLKRGVIVIPPERVIPVFRALIERFDLQNTRLRLIGFSQGGWMLPHLAGQLRNVLQGVFISCGFSSRDFPERIPFRIDAVHGAEDPISDLSCSQSQYEEVRARSRQGEFLATPGKHEIDQAKIDALTRLLAVSFPAPTQC